MTRNIAIRSWQAGTLVVAVLLGTTGCQSAPWSMPSPSLPSMTSWSPFKAKDAESSSLASAKPTSKSNVPPPVGSSASGSSLASSRSGSSIPADPMTRSSRYQRDTASESTGAASDSSSRMASNNKDAYRTGPYSTGAGYRPYGNSAPTNSPPANSSSRDGGDNLVASRPASTPMSASMANTGPQTGYGSRSERSGYSPSGYAPRVASNPVGNAGEDRPARPNSRVSASVSDDGPSPYPSTRTPNLPTALSNASNYRPGSVSRGVMPASFQNGNAQQAEAPGTEDAPATAAADSGSDSIYR
jgi:hypothetical protein